MQSLPQGKEQQLKLIEITRPPALQSRVEMCPRKTAEYQVAYNNGATFPPVLVAKEMDKHGNISYSLIDGWHRVNALENNKVPYTTKINAIVIEVPQDTSIHLLRYMGAQQNLKNGLSLSSADKRAMFKSYVKSKSNKDGNRYKSYRVIAAELVLIPHQTIARWMKSDFPRVAAMMSKEFGDEYAGQPSAKGTGIKLVDMPDLSSRDRDIFAAELIAEAKASEDNSREEIKLWARTLLSDLEREAPYIKPKPLFNPEDNDPF